MLVVVIILQAEQFLSPLSACASVLSGAWHYGYLCLSPISPAILGASEGQGLVACPLTSSTPFLLEEEARLLFGSNIPLSNTFLGRCPHLPHASCSHILSQHTFSWQLRTNGTSSAQSQATVVSRYLWLQRGHDRNNCGNTRRKRWEWMELKNSDCPSIGKWPLVSPNNKLPMRETQFPKW
jgi:hypothetical protein